MIVYWKLHWTIPKTSTTIIEADEEIGTNMSDDFIFFHEEALTHIVPRDALLYAEIVGATREEEVETVH